MNIENVQMLNETLDILHKGFYLIKGKEIRLKLTTEEMETAHVLLPQDVQKIRDNISGQRHNSLPCCEYTCVNRDSFFSAIELSKEASFLSERRQEEKPILVLNFANPVNPGGGVRRGARAQEEDLCRKSSLLLSLEGTDAAEYYAYNRSLHTFMGSHAIILTPFVEIIRDENGSLMDETYLVAVLTCAAPMITRGMEGLTNDQYQEMLFTRIKGILLCAAYYGYHTLVLGAWGCGAFGNDAALMSDLFYRALKELRNTNVMNGNRFRRIEFAVLDRTHLQYNYKQFARNFSSDLQ